MFYSGVGESGGGADRHRRLSSEACGGDAPPLISYVDQSHPKCSCFLELGTIQALKVAYLIIFLFRASDKINNNRITLFWITVGAV